MLSVIFDNALYHAAYPTQHLKSRLSAPEAVLYDLTNLAPARGSAGV